MNKFNKGISIPLVIVIIAVVVLVGGGATYYYITNSNSQPKPVACAEEAKVCPDGSSVGRTGPNCEFAQCPDIIVEDGPEIREAEASKFCSKKNWSVISYIESSFVAYAAAVPVPKVFPSFYFNFDQDSEKEIVGLCEPDWWGGYRILFVLDKQDGEYKTVFVKDAGTGGQRHYNLSNLTVNDIDRDNIDEIIFEESSWWGAGRNYLIHLYSPRYQEWFWRDLSFRYNMETGKIDEGVSYSSSTNLQEYKAFKDFLVNSPRETWSPE